MTTRLARPSVIQRGVLEAVAFLLADDRAAGEDGEVLEHRLATIAEARCLDGSDFQRAAKLVHDERGEGFAFDVFGDDEERRAHLGDLLEDREEVLHRRDLLVVNQDEGVFEDGLHVVRIRDEVRREVAAVELHALDDVEGRVGAFRFLDRDDAVLADAVERIRDEFADRVVVVGRDGATWAISFLPSMSRLCSRRLATTRSTARRCRA
jgi:hypothetical protein